MCWVPAGGYLRRQIPLGRPDLPALSVQGVGSFSESAMGLAGVLKSIYIYRLVSWGAPLLGHSGGSDWETAFRSRPGLLHPFTVGFVPFFSVNRILGPITFECLYGARLRSNFGKNLSSVEGNSRTNYRVTQERQMD